MPVLSSVSVFICSFSVVLLGFGIIRMIGR